MRLRTVTCVGVWVVVALLCTDCSRGPHPDEVLVLEATAADGRRIESLPQLQSAHGAILRFSPHLDLDNVKGLVRRIGLQHIGGVFAGEARVPTELLQDQLLPVDHSHGECRVDIDTLDDGSLGVLHGAVAFLSVEDLLTALRRRERPRQKAVTPAVLMFWNAAPQRVTIHEATAVFTELQLVASDVRVAYLADEFETPVDLRFRKRAATASCSAPAACARIPAPHGQRGGVEGHAHGMLKAHGKPAMGPSVDIH